MDEGVGGGGEGRGGGGWVDSLSEACIVSIERHPKYITTSFVGS
jgi:hypothetical protein